MENKIEHKTIENKQKDVTAIRIITANPFWRRVLNVFKNPITYLLYGRVEY